MTKHKNLSNADQLTGGDETRGDETRGDETRALPPNDGVIHRTTCIHAREPYKLHAPCLCVYDDNNNTGE